MPVVDRRSVLAGMAAASLGGRAGTARARDRRWWRDAVIYQIYPRSFMDSNGDGVGDLPGITARLDHVQRLGVDAVWLSPHFDSPDADNGYDIRDYRKVQPAFGTMADFDAMLAAMRARGIRLIIDLVVNHTSDDHAWFAASRRSRDNPYRDFYVWRDGREGGPPNNYPSFFGGSAWTRDAATGQYYLHYFHRKQPDLNWANPRVRAAVHDIARFWLAKGVAGFRMDVIAFIAKQPGLPDLTREELTRGAEYVYASGPDLARYLHEFRREVLDRYGAVAIGETWGVTPAAVRMLIDARTGLLDLALASDVADVGRAGWRTKPWSVTALKRVLARQDAAPGPHGWNALFLGNHDYPRMLSHFGDDDPAWRARSAQALATLLLTRRATPFIYQGEELGMTNFPFRDIAEFDDVGTRAKWAELTGSGERDPAVVLRELARTSRDNARTPMQWDASPGAGFTAGKPWLAVSPNAGTINAEAQAADPASTLNHNRRLIALRRRTPALRSGAYRDLLPDHPQVFAYARGVGADEHLVVINFGQSEQRFVAPALVDSAPLLASAGPRVRVRGGAITLGGWQSAILRARPREGSLS